MLNNFAIAVGELIRDFHVTRYGSDKGFGKAVLRSFCAIVLGL